MSGNSMTETILRNALNSPHTHGVLMVNDKAVMYRVDGDKITTFLEYVPYIQGAVSPEFYAKHIRILLP